MQKAIDTDMKAKITELRPATILFLAGPRLSIPEGKVAILLPLPIPWEILKESLLSGDNQQDLEDLRQHLQVPDNASNEVTLQLQSVPRGNTSCIVEIQSKSLTLVTGSVFLEIMPRWVPFLIIPMSITPKAEAI